MAQASRRRRQQQWPHQGTTTAGSTDEALLERPLECEYATIQNLRQSKADVMQDMQRPPALGSSAALIHRSER